MQLKLRIPKSEDCNLYYCESIYSAQEVTKNWKIGNQNDMLYHIFLKYDITLEVVWQNVANCPIFFIFLANYSR